MLRLIVLRARMRGRKEVLLAERLAAVLALERQEVDKVTVLVRTLLSDGQQFAARFVGWGRDVHRRARHRWSNLG